MKAIITGRAGFVGSHLSELLKSKGFEVYGFELRNDQDLRNYEQVRNIVNAIRPDYIYHLAAQAYVPESFTNPQRTFEVNTIGSINLLEAVKQVGIKTKVLLAGTSEEYGDSEAIETACPEPKSPYAISKLAMDYLGRLYAKSYGMNIVVTRAFNHTGAGRGEMYAESAFAKQIAEIEAGKRKELQHGNLSSIRNYTDVSDIVRAYMLAIELPSDVYNICSDQNVSIQYVLDELIKLSKVKIKTKTNQSLYRPADFSFKTPSCKKFQSLTNWEPEYKLKDTLGNILEYWRKRL